MRAKPSGRRKAGDRAEYGRTEAKRAKGELIEGFGITLGSLCVSVGRACDRK
jgi:hypothetical protein